MDFPPAHNVTTGSSCPGLGTRCVQTVFVAAAEPLRDIPVSFSLQRLVLCQALPRHNFKEL